MANAAGFYPALEGHFSLLRFALRIRVQGESFHTKLRFFHSVDFQHAIVSLDRLRVAAHVSMPRNRPSPRRSLAAPHLFQLIRFHEIFERSKERNERSLVMLSYEFLQRFEPVYMEATNNYGRPHFFAPRKNFLGKSVDTFWFNLAVIWSMSLTLGLTLYFDLLKKFMNAIGNFTDFMSSGRKKKE